MTVGRGAVRIDNGQSDIVVRDSVFRLKTPTSGDSLPVGIEIQDGHDILIQNIRTEDFLMQPVKGVYPNGDCFSDERKASRVRFVQTYALRCTNGGYDLKGVDDVLDRATAEKVNYCARIWGRTKATTFACKQWAYYGDGGAVQVQAGGYAEFNLIKVYPTPGKAVTAFGVGKGATLIVTRCEGKLPAGSRWLYYQPGANPSNTTVKLGPGCK